jgi:hypothetical protein
LFDRFIAFICPGENDEWIVLKHSNLAPRLYVDALWSMGGIIAVTSGDGAVFSWQPYPYGLFFTTTYFLGFLSKSNTI